MPQALPKTNFCFLVLFSYNIRRYEKISQNTFSTSYPTLIHKLYTKIIHISTGRFSILCPNIYSIQYICSLIFTIHRLSTRIARYDFVHLFSLQNPPNTSPTATFTYYDFEEYLFFFYFPLLLLLKLWINGFLSTFFFFCPIFSQKMRFFQK